MAKKNTFKNCKIDKTKRKINQNYQPNTEICLTDNKKKNVDMLFGSGNEPIENLKGVVINSNFDSNEFGIVEYFSVQDGKGVVIQKKIPFGQLNTTGIAMWGAGTYHAFYPEKEVNTILLGESVKMPLKEGVVLNLSSLANRIENLSEVIKYVKEDEAKQIVDSMQLLIKSYVIKLYEKFDFSREDKDYISSLISSIPQTDPKQVPDLFKKVKKVCNAKMRDKNDNKHFYDVKKQDAKKVKVKQEEKWYDRYR